MRAPAGAGAKGGGVSEAGEYYQISLEMGGVCCLLVREKANEVVAVGVRSLKRAYQMCAQHAECRLDWAASRGCLIGTRRIQRELGAGRNA